MDPMSHAELQTAKEMAEAAQRRSAFLAEASALLTASLDYAGGIRRGRPDRSELHMRWLPDRPSRDRASARRTFEEWCSSKVGGPRGMKRSGRIFLARKRI